VHELLQIAIASAQSSARGRITRSLAGRAAEGVQRLSHHACIDFAKSSDRHAITVSDRHLTDQSPRVWVDALALDAEYAARR